MAEFSQLSDLDFEEFVADLMSAVTKLEFNAGARGRDAGVDALAEVDGERHVIQCKHFVQSPVSTLEGAARKEAKRLAGLEKPYASYRFITSKPLSHTQRDRLVKILEPWVGSRENVLGGNELVVHLKDHFEVERRHPKLWFSGVGQLRQALSAESYERRIALIEEVRPRAPRYVETGAFRRARRLLYEQRVCIVDGPAGVGKTTLAQLLLLESLESGFELFEVVPGSLGKAWELLANEEGQVFYFDDFLGSTSLSEMREHDRDLIRFIRRIAGDSQRRLILTTRDYILTQAKRRSEILKREVDDSLLFHLTTEQYTRHERARIFYNHIYFSPEVDATARKSLVAGGDYLEVIDHDGYNPRVIEAVTGFSGHKLSADEKVDYGRFCLEALNSPEDLWSHPFEQGLEEQERALVLAILGLGARVRPGVLETAFEAACAARGLATTGRRFQHALSTLQGSFISSVEVVVDDRPRYSLINPSLVDYLESYLSESRADAEALLRSACFLEQAVWLGHAFERRSNASLEALQPLFSDTLERLFDSPLLRHSMSYLDDDPAWAELDHRLLPILPFCKHRWFREASSGWLPSHVERWLAWFDGEKKLELRELERLRTLLEYDLVDPVRVADRVKASIGALEPGYPWEILDFFARLCPEAITLEFIDEQGMALEYHTERVFERPTDFFGVAESVEDFAATLREWTFAVADEDVERAVEEIEQARAERRKQMEKAGEPEDFGLESWDEFRVRGWYRDDEAKDAEEENGRDDDEEIEAMFARLLGG
jgi:hypothetical protein